MGKSSGSAPTPPNPERTAAAQAAANREAVRESALVNQINQVTPFGSLTYTGAVGSPDRTATTTLAPAQQQMLDYSNQAGIGFGQLANQQLSAVSDRLASPLDFGSFGAVPQANEQTRQATAAAMMDRLNPQFDRDLNALETRLANQGIGYGSQAYSAAMDDFNRSRNDARLAVDAQAGNEMARMLGMQLQSRNQGLTETVQQRQIPLNELAAMLSGSQVQSPQFMNTGGYQVAPADIMGATYANYNGALNNYNMQQQQNASNMQGLFGLLGAGAQAYAYNPMAWSDRRLKRDIVRIGERNGLPLYVWRYVWGALGIGHMADEVRRVKPEAVHSVNGYDLVNYGVL